MCVIKLQRQTLHRLIGRLVISYLLIIYRENMINITFYSLHILYNLELLTSALAWFMNRRSGTSWTEDNVWTENTAIYGYWGRNRNNERLQEILRSRWHKTEVYKLQMHNQMHNLLGHVKNLNFCWVNIQNWPLQRSKSHTKEFYLMHGAAPAPTRIYIFRSHKWWLSPTDRSYSNEGPDIGFFISSLIKSERRWWMRDLSNLRNHSDNSGVT